MTDNFKEIGSLFGREGAGAGFAKQTDKESFTYAFASRCSRCRRESSIRT